MPAELITDNGKQFTDGFGQGGEVLFDRICRHNGIGHLLTAGTLSGPGPQQTLPDQDPVDRPLRRCDSGDI